MKRLPALLVRKACWPNLFGHVQNRPLLGRLKFYNMLKLKVLVQDGLVSGGFGLGKGVL